MESEAQRPTLFAAHDARVVPATAQVTRRPRPTPVPNHRHPAERHVSHGTRSVGDVCAAGERIDQAEPDGGLQPDRAEHLVVDLLMRSRTAGHEHRRRERHYGPRAHEQARRRARRGPRPEDRGRRDFEPMERERHASSPLASPCRISPLSSAEIVAAGPFVSDCRLARRMLRLASTDDDALQRSSPVARRTANTRRRGRACAGTRSAPFPLDRLEGSRS
jgi:hypothetical protein